MKKTVLIVLSLIFLVTLTISIVIVSIYNQVDLNHTFTFEGNYVQNGATLFNKELFSGGENTSSLFFNPTLGTFDILNLQSKTFDFGEFKYYVINNKIVPVEKKYENFFAANRSDKFIYIDNNGKKYEVIMESSKIKPLFEGSIEGVDSTATAVTHASSNGNYFAFASLAGELIIYERENPSEYKIINIRTVNLTSYNAEEIKILRFVNSKHFIFRLKINGAYKFFVCDASTGNTLECSFPKDSNENSLSTKSDILFSKLFALGELSNEEKNDKDSITRRDDNILEGTEYTLKFDKEIYESAELLNVSSDGRFSVIKVMDKNGKEELLLQKYEGKTVSLSSCISEGETCLDIYFIYKNVLFFNYSNNTSASYKICF